MNIRQVTIVTDIRVSSRLFFGSSWRIELKNFRDLLVWQKSYALTLACYRHTRDFPKCELYGITTQIRRCSASIAANIAEGCGKRGNAEFQRFLNIAAGSASELEYTFCLRRI